MLLTRPYGFDYADACRGYLEHADDAGSGYARGTDQTQLFQIPCQRVEVLQGVGDIGPCRCPGARHDGIGVAFGKVVDGSQQPIRLGVVVTHLTSILPALLTGRDSRVVDESRHPPPAGSKARVSDETKTFKFEAHILGNGSVRDRDAQSQI